MLRMLRHFVFLFSLVFVAGLAHEARADTATAQALFDQGKKLMAEKKYAEACSKFEESQKLDPGLGTQTNLAICYEAMGRTASAWSLYLEVAGTAKATNQTDREKRARDAAKALEGKLSKLTIEVTGPVEGLEVKRNGQPVGQATWGTPIPVDPGEVKITAVAPKRKLWETSIKIDKPGESKVTVPELEKGEPPAGYYPTASSTPTGTAPTYYGQQPPALPPRPMMKRRSTGLMVGGIIAMPVGLVMTLAGAVIGVADSGVYGGDGATGIGVAVVGLVLLGGGIAMTAIGAKKVPVNPEKQGSALVTSPIPEVRIGLGSVQAAWQF
jgi:hypothetical protein